jgi:hypothetical protein
MISPSFLVFWLRGIGGQAWVEGKDLVLVFPREPDKDVLDLFRKHKRGIVALLRQRGQTSPKWPKPGNESPATSENRQPEAKCDSVS